MGAIIKQAILNFLWCVVYAMGFCTTCFGMFATWLNVRLTLIDDR